MQDDDPNATLIILKTLSILLLVMGFGMLGAWFVGWLDLSPLIPFSLMTVGFSGLVIVKSSSSAEEADD